MLAAGFFHVDCPVSLQRLYCLFVIEAGSRSVPIPGVTANPDGPRTTQQTRSLVMDPGDRAADLIFRFLARDRAGQLTASVDVLARAPASRPGKSRPGQTTLPLTGPGSGSSVGPVLGGLTSQYQRAA
jgi:hypothetical protein